MEAINVIRKPVITEKSSLLQEKKVYAFWVNPKATKIDVKLAIKTLYGADVEGVRMVKIPGKFRAIKKGTMNKRREFNKAYVTLKNSGKLDLNKFEKSDKETKIKLAGPKVSKPKAEKAPKAEKKATVKKSK